MTCVGSAEHMTGKRDEHLLQQQNCLVISASILVSTETDESLTGAEFGKHLHRVIKSLLAKEIKSIEILDVVYLLLLITV